MNIIYPSKCYRIPPVLSFYNIYIPITCFLLVSPLDCEFQAVRLAHGCAWQSSHSIYVVRLISHFSYSSLTYKYRSKTPPWPEWTKMLPQQEEWALKIQRYKMQVTSLGGSENSILLVGLCCYKEPNTEN